MRAVRGDVARIGPGSDRAGSLGVMSPLEGLAASPLAPSGREPIVEITPEALEKLIELRDAEPDGESLGLRLELASEPGEPFRYDLSFDEYLSAAFTDEVRTSAVSR